MRQIFTASLLALSLVLGGAAWAETTPAPASAPAAGPAATAPAKFAPAVIAVVDMQKIMHESAAAKSAREQLSARRQSYQQEVTADEQKLREAEKKLMEQRSSLSPEDFAKRRTEFEAQVRQVQQKVQRRAQALDAAMTQALGTIKQSLGKIVAQAASDRGATVVLDRGQTIVVESSLDITAPVLAQLNKDLPKVTVTVNEAAAAPASAPAARPAAGAQH